MTRGQISAVMAVGDCVGVMSTVGLFYSRTNGRAELITGIEAPSMMFSQWPFYW